jgi:hypothetical protein
MPDLTFRTHQCSDTAPHDRHWVAFVVNGHGYAGFECAGVPTPSGLTDDVAHEHPVTTLAEVICQLRVTRMTPQEIADAILATGVVVPAADVIPKQATELTVGQVSDFATLLTEQWGPFHQQDVGILTSAANVMRAARAGGES